MSSGITYPKPTYIPPLPIFNPLFFPQSFGTTTTSGGGGGGFTNIFPNGLTSGNVITMDGGTGGGGGTGAERTITGLSQIEWVDFASTNPTTITGYMVLNGNTLEIGSNTASSGINVNLLGSVVSANGVAIATGGNVSNNQSNTFQSGFIQQFDGQLIVDNTQTNIGQLTLGLNNTAIGDNALISLTTGEDNTAYGNQALQDLTTGDNNTAVGYNCLTNIISGQSNTAVGYACLSSSTIDINNVALGFWSGLNLNGNGTDSNNNTFIGYEAGINQTTGSNNVAVGFQTGVSPSPSTLSNTIAIGSNVSPTTTNDIILGSSGNYVKFFNTGNGYGLSTLTGGTDPNFSLVSGNALLYNAQGVHIMYGQAIQLQNVYGSGLAGKLQIQSGSNGGGSLQVQDNGSNPPTNTGFGNFASVNGLPFYYSPITTSWSQLATTTNNVLFSITTSVGSGVSPPGTWTFTLPNSTYPQQFLYYAYLNLQAGAGTTISAPAYAVGTNVATSNSNTIFGYGQAVYTTWNTNTGISPIIPGYGYVFNTISSIGSTNFSINTISQSGNSAGTTTYNLVCDSLNSATFTIIGLSIT